MSVLVSRMGSSSALDAPRTVRLATRGAVGLVLLAPDHDRLLVLPAVLAVGELIGPGWGDRAGIPGLGVLPDRGLTGLVLLEGTLRRFGRHSLVPRVEPVTDEPADQHSAEAGAEHGAGATSGCRGDAGS